MNAALEMPTRAFKGAHDGKEMAVAAAKGQSWKSTVSYSTMLVTRKGSSTV